jgi:hypothetical protein
MERVMKAQGAFLQMTTINHIMNPCQILMLGFVLTSIEQT